ncbi:MAG: tRNA lysidine(34) synthetase TilS [Lachnospiraceae bacterium]|nr:tRNA lysidine(34) synthetase TilS [Lachnospiraceae bacterium]
MIGEIAAKLLQDNRICASRVLLGLSGGADSVYLFYVLKELRDMGGPQFFAVHINHMLRGEAADTDEMFVRELCERFGVELYVRHADVAELARLNHQTVEQAGRSVRYEEFFAHASEGDDNTLFLAHHGNDHEETMLMNFLRGSGAKGLSGIRPESVIRKGDKSIHVLRPLLGISHSEICEELRNNGVLWCEDATNMEADCTRNKLRLEIIPMMREINPGLFKTMKRAGDTFAQLDDYMCAQAEAFIDAHVNMAGGEVSAQVVMLGKLHPALCKYVIRGMIARLDVLTDISAEHVEDVLGLLGAQSGRRIMLPREIVACRDFDRLVIRVGEARDLPQADITISYADAGEFDEKKYKTDELVKWYDADALREACGEEPVVRTMQEGDYLLIDEQGRRKLLKTYLKQARVSADARRDVSVVACGSLILYVAGLRGSEGFRVTDKTKHLLKIECDC